MLAGLDVVGTVVSVVSVVVVVVVDDDECYVCKFNVKQRKAKIDYKFCMPLTLVFKKRQRHIIKIKIT